MIRVLFVDDEAAVLEGLENRLRPLRKRWNMRFALGGEQALKELASAPADVIVSDMRMPGIDGAQLLDLVRERYPQTARFVLSGQTNEDSALHVLPIAHQLLTKPCDATTLERAVERVCGLHNRMEHPGVRKAVGMLRNLPALPRLYWDLLQEIDKPQSSPNSIAAIIEQDVAMTARLLQMANSAFFGGRRIFDAREAIVMMGLLPIRSMVLSLQLCRAMSGICEPRGFSLDQLQAHSLRTAQLAASMLKDSEQRKTAFSAGMLHDIGKLVLAVGMPDEWSVLSYRAAASRQTQENMELELLGCSHAEIGAHMLSLWGLPAPLIDAVAYHHNPAAAGESRFGAIAAIHVANAMANEEPQGVSHGGNELHAEFLESIGAADHVAAWRRGEPVKAL